MLNNNIKKMVKIYMVFLKSFNPYRIIIWRNIDNTYIPNFAEIYERLTGYTLIKDGLEFYDIIVEPITGNIIIQDFINNEIKMAGNVHMPGQFRVIQKKGDIWFTKITDVLSNITLSDDGIDHITLNMTVLNKFIKSVKMHNYGTIQVNLSDDELILIP